MGKKSKKLNKTLDVQVPVANEDPSVENVTNLAKPKKSNQVLNSEIPDSNYTENTNIKKKKRKHASGDVITNTSVQIASDDRLQAVEDKLNQSATSEVPKKKKKKHSTNKEESIGKTEIDNASNESNIPKKKKKSDLFIEKESKPELDQTQVPIETESETSKKKKKKSNLQNGDSATREKTIDKTSDFNVVKEKVTKSQKKKKTGTAVLNAEEAQVTEEDIDKFCDELNEEDNKQYEDWVKLIEANLRPPRKNE